MIWARRWLAPDAVVKRQALARRFHAATAAAMLPVHEVLPELKAAGTVATHDASTNGLINYFKERRKA